VIPVIALVGRPNVGKSTLFNALTRSRDALVADFPGLTRDRLYGSALWCEQPLIVIDTGGLDDPTTQPTGLSAHMGTQSLKAVEEADLILFLVDGRCGLTESDSRIAQQLRLHKKPIVVAVNKVEGLDERIAVADFYRLGLGDNLLPIAAAHHQGIGDLMHSLVALLTVQAARRAPPDQNTEAAIGSSPTEHSAPLTPKPTASTAEALPDTQPSAPRPARGSPLYPIKVAIVGRPNVGKSLLTNRILGEERVVVYDLPGTTRDSVTIPLQRRGCHYAIIDTAGLRRRARVHEKIEKFSIVKTLQAIEQAQVVLMVLDAHQGISDQDLSLLGFILEQGRALVLVVNKWDGLDQAAKSSVQQNLERRLAFINFARIHFISALQNQGIAKLFTSITEAYQSATRSIGTSIINRILQEAQREHLPPLVQGRRVKLKFAHLGGHNPPTIVIHGNQLNALPEAYRRYLINRYRQALNIMGTPIVLQFKTSENPYADRRNPLTLTQQRQRQRIIQYRKKQQR
jgi:GTP-binding protein